MQRLRNQYEDGLLVAFDNEEIDALAQSIWDAGVRFLNDDDFLDI